MGNCCEPKLEDRSNDERQPARTTELTSKSKDPRGTALNATSLAGLRQKYERWLQEKDETIRKNEAEAEVKERKLRELETAGKTLDCEKMRRQIDTHRKFVKQAQEDKVKIQEKLDNL